VCNAGRIFLFEMVDNDVEEMNETVRELVVSEGGMHYRV